MLNCKIPCLICKKVLENVQEEHENHPMGGIEFITYGHYGSTVFDPMNGSCLVANVCDECLQKAIDSKDILIADPEPQPSTRILKVYNGT